MDDNNVAVLTILDDQNQIYKPNMTLETYDTQNQSTGINQVDLSVINDTNRQNITWTKEATLTLLSMYEAKVPTIDNPKKKSKMWISIAEDLKAYNFMVTPDQVRWKINSLTKKYKDCIENGQNTILFKYFNVMHQILGRCNSGNDTYRLSSFTGPNNATSTGNKHNMKSSIPSRRLKAERRAKVELDKEWLEYLKRQDSQQNIREEKIERSLWLREEELQLRKKELEIKQTIALKKLQLKERKQEEMLKIEREKCALLKKLIENKNCI